jgi:hypothetical protein
MKKSTAVAAIAAFFGIAAIAAAAGMFNQVRPWLFDPANTQLVQSGWLSGIGCPTNGRISTDGSTTTPYTDPACPTGDPRDRSNQGLLLVKTGPTANFAAAGAELKTVKGMTVTELGYDIRKPGVSADPRGSHCGAGAPRFDITTKNGQSFFLGCNSPPAPVQQPGNGWLRLRWGGTTPLMAFNATTGALVNIGTLEIKSIDIVFDEGQDAGPDNFGLAVLDNIDVNGKLVGQGAGPKSSGNGEDDNDDHKRHSKDD